MSNIKPGTPIWVLCSTLKDITDRTVSVWVQHHGENFYAHLEDCKLDDPPDMLPSPVTEAKKVRYKRNKMKVGDKVDEAKFVHRPELGDTVVFPNGLRIVVHDNNEQGFTVVQDAPKSEAVEQANTIKFKVGDPVVSYTGRKGIVDAVDPISEFPITVIHAPHTFVRYQIDYIFHDRTVQKPSVDSSMRQLNWNEVVQDGDVLVTINDRYAGYKQPLTIYVVDSIGKRVDDAFSKGKKLGLTKLFYRRIEKGTK
jgi:hypothetical protein